MSRRRRSTYRGRKAPFRFRKGYNRTSGYYRSNAKAATEVKFIDGFADSDVLSTPEPVRNDSGHRFDFHSTGNTPGTGWGAPIFQGTGENDRIGRKILIKSIHVRGMIEMKEASLDVQDWTDTIRFLFILDKQANGSTFTVSDVLEDATAGQAVWSFKNLRNKKRFAILKDFNMTLNGLTNGAVDRLGRISKTVECHLTNLNIPVEYDSTLGDLTEVKSNHLICLMLSQHEQISVHLQFRTRFIG